jgi:hypothetical protein
LNVKGLAIALALGVPQQYILEKSEIFTIEYGQKMARFLPKSAFNRIINKRD